MTSAIDTTRAVDPVVNRLGAGLMFHPACLGTGAEHGLDDGLAFYAGGRLGVIGDAPIPVAVAAAAWFEPGMVDKVLSRARTVAPSLEMAGWYADGLAAAARATWGTLDGLDRFCALAAKVAAAAPPGGLALFTGWRALPRPDDAAGASGVEIQTLRELRGDLHIQAMAGIEPHLAAMLGGGADKAAMFGWSEPHPDPAGLEDRRREAEEHTDALMAGCYEVLDEDERAELVALVGAMKDAARAPGQ